MSKQEKDVEKQCRDFRQKFESLRNEISELRLKGERVVQELPGQEVIPEELSCDRELINEKGKWVVKALSR